MILTVLERLVVLQLLPRRGDLTTLRIVRDLERDLSFSEEEHAALNFRKEGTATRWNEGVVPDKEAEIGAVGQQLVVDGLMAAEQSGREFDISILELCDKLGYEGIDGDADKRDD